MRCLTITSAVACVPLSTSCTTRLACPWRSERNFPSGDSCTTDVSLRANVSLASVTGEPSRSRGVGAGVTVSPSASNAIGATSIVRTTGCTTTGALVDTPVSGSRTSTTVAPGVSARSVCALSTCATRSSCTCTTTAG